MAAHVDPLISDVAKGGVKLAEEMKNARRELSGKIRVTAEEKRQIEQRTRQLESEFEQLTSRADAAGFTNDIGRMLRDHRRTMPSLVASSAVKDAREQEITKAHIKKLDFQSRRKNAFDVETLIDETIEAHASDMDEVTRQQIERDLRRLYSLRETLLEGVTQDQTTYLAELIGLESAESEQQAETREQSEYISEHILWVRSAHPIQSADVYEVGDSIRGLLHEVVPVGTALKKHLVEQPIFYLLASLPFFLLIGFRWRIRRVLRRAGV